MFYREYKHCVLQKGSLSCFTCSEGGVWLVGEFFNLSEKEVKKRTIIVHQSK